MEQNESQGKMNEADDNKQSHNSSAGQHAGTTTGNATGTDEKDKPEDASTTSDETKASIENGRKAIESSREATPDPAPDAKEKESKDAENWRNEG